jgi:hypothetical protein
VLQCLSTITARSRPGVWQGGLVCTFINDCVDNSATAETRSECIELMRVRGRLTAFGLALEA